MKYDWVELSRMLIAKVMHYLLINGSSHLGRRWPLLATATACVDREGDVTCVWIGHPEDGEKGKGGEESRGGRGEGRGEGTGQERTGEEEGGGGGGIHSCDAYFRCGHTPQYLVLLDRVKYKCIINLANIKYELTRSGSQCLEV